MTTNRTKTTIEDHREAVATYREISTFAASGYPERLTDEQRDAYSLLPTLMDDCKEKYDALPVESRPNHYLLTA